MTDSDPTDTESGSLPPHVLLDGLDDEQRRAAEALLGPVVILAGAGTGKTRAITHRIAYGVATGVYPPNRVMALTFTARAASQLRSRLRELGTTGVAARTFHSAALSQLSYFWPQLTGHTAPAVLDGKARLLAQAAERARLRVDTATLRDVASDIEWRKVSRLSLEDYARSLDMVPDAGGRPAPGRLTATQAVALQAEYERLKDERRMIDFEDVLLACAGMIETEPQVALYVREQYRFFVVDEYQDVSPLQQQLLEAWLGDRDDVCVVGDASQTIYSFAGADNRYLLDFERRRPGAITVRLEENFRSTLPIVQTANRLMRGRRGAVVLRARATPPAADPEPQISEHRSDEAEARAVAVEVRADLDAGIAPERIAVLYRINVQGVALERALADGGIGTLVRGSKRFFDLPEVKQAILALRGASVSVRGEPLFKSVSDVLRGIGWSNQPPPTHGAVRERWESLNALMRLADEAAAGTTFRRFTDELLERQAAQHEPPMAAVTLTTLHSAKGLEWDSVHLVGLSEGLLPIGYAKTDAEIDEERRLLYVGITRARRRLRLSWSSESGRRNGSRSPSRFLAELGTRTRDAGASAAR